jgi:hypothetical protein
MKVHRALLIIFGLPVILSNIGCASYKAQQDLRSRVQQLEKRVIKIEEQKETKAMLNSAREQLLETCILIDSEEEYWSYVRLNGKKIGEGKYKAPTYIWDQARNRKRDKIEECKLLYGR